MSTAGHTPNFVAEEAVYPFRCVKVGSLPFKAVQSTGDPEILLGVTDGSVQGFNSTVHAAIGQPISLQNGEFVQLTAGGIIATGDTLVASTDGKVVAGTSSTEYIAQAVEDAEDGEVFWAKKIGAWTVGGGGGGGTMTVNVQEFDDPEAENVWTKPAGAMMVYVTMCGGGQDGSPGNFIAGTGGGAGRYAEKLLGASALPSTVAVQVGLHRPIATMPDTTMNSYFGEPQFPICAAFPGGFDDDTFGSNSGPTPNTDFQSGYRAFGWGGGEWSGIGSINGQQGWGPGGGGSGGNPAYSDLVNGGEGGRAGTSGVGFATGYMNTPFDWGVSAAGGGAGGIGDAGIEPGGDGGNGSIDPITGFGGGGGGGGYSGSDVAGNGGNGIRGGGGGGGGLTDTGTPGIGGQGGDGYVRVTTICFS